MRLIVTVDTEADNQWTLGSSLRVENARFWPRFQALCEEVGIQPVYLVTTEVVRDADALELLRVWGAAGRAEVGAHLHPWSTPPFVDAPGLRENDPAHAFPCELPLDLLCQKVANLTGEIRRGVGGRPLSFRAGRFGIDAEVAGVLSEAGYRVDSSVTPGISWNAVHGGSVQSRGPDFVDAPCHPYHPSRQDICREGESPLWEIPLTIVPMHPLLRRWDWLRRWIGRRYAAFAGRAVGQLVPALVPQWLRPSPRSEERYLVRVWEAARSAGAAYAVLMVHSSELMPGGSPYWRTESDVNRLYGQLQALFFHLREGGGQACTLTEAADRLDEKRYT